MAFLPVCDEHGDLCGIIAYRHIGWPCAVQGGDPATVTAASLTEEPPVTIGVDDPGGPRWQVMARAAGVWLLPVLAGRRLVGVIHYTDIAATTSFATLGTTLGITSAELRRRTRRRRRRPRPLLGDPNTRDLNPSNLTTKEMRDASR